MSDYAIVRYRPDSRVFDRISTVGPSTAFLRGPGAAFLRGPGNAFASPLFWALACATAGAFAAAQLHFGYDVIGMIIAPSLALLALFLAEFRACGPDPNSDAHWAGF
jgi:hypothetical protein